MFAETRLKKSLFSQRESPLAFLKVKHTRSLVVGQTFLVKPFHKQSVLPEVGVPVKGGEAVPRRGMRSGALAPRSTLDGVTVGKRIALQKRFDPVYQD